LTVFVVIIATLTPLLYVTVGCKFKHVVMFYYAPGLRQEFQSNPDATWNCWNLRKSFRGSPVKISSFGIIHESGPASLLGHTTANYSEETDATFQAQSDRDPAYPIDKAALLFLTVNKRCSSRQPRLHQDS
jgi:hypothetical protein